MSQSNEERNRAEAAFEELCKQPEAAAPLLCAGMTQSADETVRSLTAVMFRKRVTVEFYNQLTPPTQIALKGALIAAVENEQVQTPRACFSLSRCPQPHAPLHPLGEAHARGGTHVRTLLRGTRQKHRR